MVDVFVFYDDVAFIKNGWINRNRILVQGAPLYFTVPLAKASSFRPINKTLIHRGQYLLWKKKFLRTLTLHYGNTPHFAQVFDLVQDTFATDPEDIATLAIRSVERCAQYLGITTEFKISSRHYPSTGTRGTRRVLDVCLKSRADVYLNAPGGKALYNRVDFDREQIVLAFLHPQLNPYPQPSKDFVPGLSILDVLMHCSPERARSMLEQYTVE